MYFTCAIIFTDIALFVLKHVSCVEKCCDVNYSFQHLQFLKDSCFIYEAGDGVTFAFQYSQTCEKSKTGRNIGVLKKIGHE